MTNHVVQFQEIYLMAVSAMPFVFNEFPNWSGASDGGCSQFCSSENLVFPQYSVALRFSMLNLNDFQEDCRVDPLVPNHIQMLIELCRDLLLLID